MSATPPPAETIVYEVHGWYGGDRGWHLAQRYASLQQARSWARYAESQGLSTHIRRVRSIWLGDGTECETGEDTDR